MINCDIDDADFLWNEFAMAADDILTPEALKMKRRIRRAVVKAASECECDPDPRYPSHFLQIASRIRRRNELQ